MVLIPFSWIRDEEFFHSLLHIVIHPFKMDPSTRFFSLFYFLYLTGFPDFESSNQSNNFSFFSGRVLPVLEFLANIHLGPLYAGMPPLLFWVTFTILSTTWSDFLRTVRLYNLCILISLLLYPFLCWRWRHIDSPLFHGVLDYLSGYSLLEQSCWFLTHLWSSPYAIPLYWSIPFLITAFFIAFECILGLAVTFLFVLIVSIASGLHLFLLLSSTFKHFIYRNLSAYRFQRGKEYTKNK